MLKQHLNSVETLNNKSYPNSFSSPVLLKAKVFLITFFKNQRLIITTGTFLFLTMESILFL